MQEMLTGVGQAGNAFCPYYAQKKTAEIAYRFVHLLVPGAALSLLTVLEHLPFTAQDML